MLPNVRNFHRPATIAEAVKLLNSDSERNVVLGGGTQLALSQTPGIDGLVDLAKLGLDYSRIEKSTIILGARTRPTDAVRFEGLSKAASGIISKAAANYLAEVQRNRASLGGILISASAWADIATALLATGGDVVVVGAEGEKSVSIDDFFTQGPQKASKRAIIKELRIPTGGIGAYQRFAKTETDISTVCVAARIDLVGSSVQRARVAVGGVSGLPVRLTEVENALVDNKLTAKLAEEAAQAVEIEAVEDFRASSEYRVDLTKTLTKRVLLELAERA